MEDQILALQNSGYDDDQARLVALVSAGDEVAGTTTPTGRVAGPWMEFYEAIPGAGFGFWARLDAESYSTVDLHVEEVDDDTHSELDDALLDGDLQEF
jgi:hypothetical protein